MGGGGSQDAAAVTGAEIDRDPGVACGERFESADVELEQAAALDDAEHVTDSRGRHGPPAVAGGRAYAA